MSFRDLHQRGNPFILANAWDAGSAKMLAGLGAQAIGTSSAAHAFTLGRPDGGHVTRDEALARARSALAEMRVEGVHTNIALHRELVDDAGFSKGGVSIHHLEHWLEQRELGNE